MSGVELHYEQTYPGLFSLLKRLRSGVLLTDANLGASYSLSQRVAEPD